jgi:hypothetical protein
MPKKGETFTSTLHAEDKTPFLKLVTQDVMGTPIDKGIANRARWLSTPEAR